jgi:hypothetical protein
LGGGTFVVSTLFIVLVFVPVEVVTVPVEGLTVWAVAIPATTVIPKTKTPINNFFMFASPYLLSFYFLLLSTITAREILASPK